MAFDPSNSAIRVDATLEEKLRGATHEEIKEILKEAAVSQNLAVREWDQSILTPTELAGASPKKFGKVVVLNGVKHSLIADDESGLLAAENELYRQTMQPVATTQQTEQPQPRNQRGQFTTQEEADRANQLELVRRTELELKFRRGEIDPATYLEESGAVADYLAKQGVPLEDLKAQVAEKQSERFTQSWASATEEFLHSSAGADWPGGENMNIAGRLIQENNLTDKPSVETLVAVWNYMKENSLAVENADASYQRELQEAQSPEQINAVNHKFFGSGLFNR